MSGTPAKHDVALTPDGLTECCDQDPRTLDGGFVVDPSKVTCSGQKTPRPAATDG